LKVEELDDMTEITKEAIDRRAMKNCEEAGFAWRPDLLQTHPGKKFVPLKTTLDEKGRNEYRKAAKEQLIKEQG
jgi:hypothetical protein